MTKKEKELHARLIHLLYFHGFRYLHTVRNTEEYTGREHIFINSDAKGISFSNVKKMGVVRFPDDEPLGSMEMKKMIINQIRWRTGIVDYHGNMNAVQNSDWSDPNDVPRYLDAVMFNRRNRL